MREIKATAERLEKSDVTTVEVTFDKRSKPHMCSRVGAVYALHAARSISDAQLGAAEDWARDYETGILGGKDPEASKQSGCPDAEYAILSRIAAADRCRYIRKSLGAFSETLLIRVMIDGLSLNNMAMAIHPPEVDDEGRPKKPVATRYDKLRVAGMLDLLLVQLAEAYTNMPENLFADWSAVPSGV
ncbi:hypothetical protein ASN_1959 [Acetobacter senegalensis]|uniref:Uncharacterized protein n=1 Tax=Acetobacter senegalensis TaxID=446692 RepID=A0A0U5EU71_9PROT|nr:hypothetical protein [Acetobacter senegalensis]CEF41274.1 hypothetical protein ASN_1959 [Acetobacter senegalensis]